MRARFNRDTIVQAVPAILVVTVGSCVLITYSVGQWRSMYVPSWDLAIFSEMAKAYAHGQAPIVPIKGDDFNLLGDHFHPILIVLGPIWRLFPSPLTLLVVQDLLLAVSAWPLTRLATRLLGRVPATALGLFYVLSWGFQGAVAAQFHEIAFAVPMLAFASAAFVEERWRACILWSAPLVLVKEDLGLTVLMIGLAIAWRTRRENADDESLPLLSRGLGLALFGLASFLVTTVVILPLLNPHGTWGYSLGGGDSTGPWLARLYSPAVKLETLAVLACTAGIIGLRSPWMMVAAPTLAWRFLGNVDFYWEWKNWHYNAVLIPIALGALLDVLAGLKRRRAAPAQAAPSPDATSATTAAATAATTGSTPRPGATTAPNPDVTTGASTPRPGATTDASAPSPDATDASAPSPDATDASAPSPATTGASAPSPGTTSATTAATGWLAAPVWARRLVVLGVSVPLIMGVFTATDLPLWAMTREDFGREPVRATAAQQVLNTIPLGTTVRTDLGLLAYLVPKATVYWVGTSTTPTDYVVVDSHSPAWGANPPKDAAAWAMEHSPGSTYELILNVGGYQVARRSE
ncbi:DUF2079 domain-containing protein [Actinomyces oricola]|uniref:DUF2079 domain-containing protein n=1 Tax=Actinomyces oricola TaxID=206043 RepID=UPI000FFEE7F3|nr:DUF2079 domain-containing protein [Actinomyces oricola]